MGTKWYYAENGERRGPATSEEIVRLIERQDAQPVLIWAGGIQMTTPLSAEEDTKGAAGAKRASLARRARDELIEYLAIAGYLAVCFGALLFYKATILQSQGVDTTRIGLAIVKALILGKFVLIRFGERLPTIRTQPGSVGRIGQRKFVNHFHQNAPALYKT